MNETTNGTLGDASASAPVNPLYGTSPAHAAAAAPAASANVDPRAYATGDGSSAGYPITAVTPAENGVTRDTVARRTAGRKPSPRPSPLPPRNAASTRGGARTCCSSPRSPRSAAWRAVSPAAPS